MPHSFISKDKDSDIFSKKRLQFTITINIRTHKMEKNVYKKKLFSIDTVYYVYCTI